MHNPQREGAGGAPRKPLAFFSFLLALALFVIVILIAGTVFAFVRPADSPPLFTFGGQAVSQDAQTDIPFASGGTGVFSGIGRLRIPLADSSTMVLSIAFPYPQDDPIFLEELALSIVGFRLIAADFFSSIPAETLPSLNEDAARAELLHRYNESLRLGRIERLYFTELLVIE